MNDQRDSIRWLVWLVLWGGLGPVCWANLSFAEPPIQQRFVVAEPVPQPALSHSKPKAVLKKKPSQPQQSQQLSTDIGSLQQASWVAQQGAIAALSFSSTHSEQLEQLALTYFSTQAWQQFMTPQVRHARHLWKKNHYLATVLVRAFPEIMVVQLNNERVLRANFPVSVDIFQGNRHVGAQAVMIHVLLSAISHAPFWKVDQWSSELISDRGHSSVFGDARGR